MIAADAAWAWSYWLHPPTGAEVGDLVKWSFMLGTHFGAALGVLWYLAARVLARVVAWCFRECCS